MPTAAAAELASIVVRTKDRPQLLARALRSIAAQEYRPLEVVLVNDGGAPPDLAAVAALLGDVALVDAGLNQNRGRAAAANAGIAAAHGRWIGFLDDDDELYPGHVEAVLAPLVRGDCRVAYAGVDVVAQRKSDDGNGWVDVEHSTLAHDFSYASLLVGNFIPLNALLFDARVLRSAGGIDESFELYEDWDLLIRIARQERFVRVDAVTARYNQWSVSEQINQADREQMRAATLRLYAKHRDLFTPEVILEYRTQRVAVEGILRGEIAHLHQVVAERQARVTHLEAVADENWRQLQRLEREVAGERAEARELGDRLARSAAELAAREAETRRLEDELSARGAELAAHAAWSRELQDLAAQRDARIHELDTALRETRAHHQSTLQQRDQRIAELESTLHALRNTLGWRALEKLRRLRERLLPQGSGRRRAFDLALRAVVVASKEGVRSAAAKARRRTARTWQQWLTLACRARTVYRQRGARAMLMAARAWWRRRNAPPLADAASATLASGDRYATWVARHERGDAAAAQRSIAAFRRRPLISIVTPVYDVDPKWLDRCIASVQRQWYPHWQLCLRDDASTRDETRQTLRRWQSVDERIVVSFAASNGGISAASNAALAMSRGEFVALLDHDDELSADALFEVASLLDAHPETDVIYSDEDRITERDDGTVLRHDPFFKPDWSPRLLFACMYTGHLSVYRRSLVDALGGFRSEYDFSQDYDLALRAAERTTRIRHLPKVLYHWRTLPTSAAGGGKDYARASNVAALQAACDRRGLQAKAIALPHSNRALLPLPEPPPLVSIIVPTDSRANVARCLELLLAHTDYPQFEILVVTTSALGAEVLRWHAAERRVRLVAFDQPFNFSAKCNAAAAAAYGDYLLFYNDDVEAVDAGWLTDMVAAFGFGNVGGVSPKLYYENDTIQFAGMITGVRGLIGTAFHTVHKDSGSYFNFVQSEREVSLLSGACMLMPKRIFDEVGGFDAERTPIMHSDADLCLRVRERGYDLVYTPFAALRHIGHLSLAQSDHEAERRKDKADLYLLKRHSQALSRDPYHPENMTELLYHRGEVPYRLCAPPQEGLAHDGADILLVSHDLSLSGAPILLVYVAEHLRAHGHFVTVMSPLDGELAATLRAKRIPVVIDATIEVDPDPLTRKFMAAFDLVVANTIVAWPSVLAAKADGTPVVWLLHESHDGCHAADGEPRMREALAAADDVVFACAATRAIWERFRRRDNFRVIPYGARPLSNAEHTGAAAPGRLRIVHIGSIERRKGQDVFLSALARLPGDIAAQLDVVMIGRLLRPEFHATIAAALEAVPFVRYVGQLPHERIAAELAAADLFVSSSRDEVFPVTIMEAMSAGKPVIATAVGGVPEMLRDGIDGLIVPPEDPGALAGAIERLVHDEAARRRMGLAARERFFANYSVDKLSDRLLELIAPHLPRPSQVPILLL